MASGPILELVVDAYNGTSSFEPAELYRFVGCFIRAADEGIALRPQSTPTIGEFVHVIRDPPDPHKAPRVRSRGFPQGQPPPAPAFHFTPTSSSWSNLVESGRTMVRRVDRQASASDGGGRSTPTSTEQAITIWAEHWNTYPAPSLEAQDRRHPLEGPFEESRPAR